MPVVRERYWLTFQPGEIRVCASCHGVNSKDQANAPVPTNPPEALRDFLRYWKQTFYVAAGVDDVSVVEGSAGSPGAAVFNVALNRATTDTVTVPYATANGTATSGTDYQPRSGTLTFTPGATVRTVAVPLVGDATDEANKTFAINLGTPVNAFIADAQGLATIVDDDGPALSVGDQSVAEGSTSATVQFTVSLASPAGALTTVDYATADVSATAGSDYVATAGTLTFAPGATSTTVAVTVNGDTLDEPDEYFAFVLSNASNPIGDATGQGTIVDDDGGAASSYSGLVHGSSRVRSLAALPGPAADQHRYVVRQDPRASYEVVVDAASGDVQPLGLRRLSAAGTVVQSSAGSGVGASRSLRWVNSGGVVDGERIVVTSGGCGTGCGPDDVYRIRFYETTGLVSALQQRGRPGYGPGAAEPRHRGRDRPGLPVERRGRALRQLALHAARTGQPGAQHHHGRRCRRADGIDHGRARCAVRRADRQGGGAGAGHRLQLRHAARDEAALRIGKGARRAPPRQPVRSNRTRPVPGTSCASRATSSATTVAIFG